jgi:hypothetical protein
MYFSSDKLITVTTTSVTPSVTITSTTTSICSGGSVTFTATPTNGGSAPTYQWMINGVNVAGQTASIFTTSSLANGNIVSVMMTSNDPCANPTIATSNSITITTTSVTPSVTYYIRLVLLYAVAAPLHLQLHQPMADQLQLING